MSKLIENMLSPIGFPQFKLIAIGDRLVIHRKVHISKMIKGKRKDFLLYVNYDILGDTIYFKKQEVNMARESFNDIITPIGKAKRAYLTKERSNGYMPSLVLRLSQKPTMTKLR
jgi:hypothetical protein